MQCLDELAGFLVGQGQQGSPLRRVERRGREHGGGNRQPVGNEIFEEPDGQRTSRNGPCSSGAQLFVDIGCFGPDRIERPPHHRACTLRSGARDEVHQLPPTHGGVVAVARGLAQHGQ